MLKNLRKPGEKGYKIPSGFLFDYITCANYFAEIWGWIFFTLGTQTLAAGLFTAAGAYQMAEWAKGKHRRLVKVMKALGAQAVWLHGLCSRNPQLVTFSVCHQVCHLSWLCRAVVMA